MKSMDDIDKKIEKLVHLVKIGATGDSEKLRIQAMRLIRALKRERDPLADELRKSIFEDKSSAPSRRSTRRRAFDDSPELISPVDRETGADLFLIEEDVQLEHALVIDDVVEEQLRMLVQERIKCEQLALFNLTPTRTVLFTGAPGVGKTMAARKIASDLGLPLFTLDLANVISSYLGGTGTNLKSALQFAENSRCVLLLDELDAIAKKRDDVSDVGEMKRIVTVILQELDRWPEESLLIAATNHYELIDAAVKRRFEQIIDFPRPSAELLKALGKELMESDSSDSLDWIDVLATLKENTSFSDFVREVNKFRRMMAISGEGDIENFLSTTFSNEFAELSTDKKKAIAENLCKNTGLSQRSIARVTGLARDTIRKI